MKKAFLLSAVMATACSAFAAAPSLGKSLLKSDVSDFAFGTKAPVVAKAPAPATRASETLEFSYSDEVYSLTMLNNVKAGQTRVYLVFELAPEDLKGLAGNTVTGFTVYTPSDESMRTNSITDAQFFYSFDLTKAEYIQDFKMPNAPFELLNVDIDTPYKITGEEPALCFGYSFVVPEKDNMYYMPYDGMPNSYSGAGAFGVSDTSEFPSGFYSFASDLGALSMSIIMEGDNYPRYVGFNQTPYDIYLPLGKSSTAQVSLFGTSSEPIESLEFSYTLDGHNYNTNFVLASPVGPGASKVFKASIGFLPQEVLFNENVTFTITKFNGKPNVCPAASVEVPVAVLSQVPERQTLIEEYTGTWCGYCTRGYAALEYIKENYPDFVVAAYHNQDPMTVTTNYPANITGFPSASLNRGSVVDPYYGSQSYDTKLPIVGDILALNAVPTPWMVKVDHAWESEDVLVAKAEVANMLGFSDKNYKIAYILVADGLSGTTRSWFQSNNYSTQRPSDDNIPELNAFCRGGQYGKSSVGGLIFNDVVVSTTGIYGVDGSIPASLEAEQVVEHTLSFDLSKISSTLIPDKNKLRVIAAVVDAHGNVLNCAKNEVDDYDRPSGVSGVIDANAPVEYFNLNGQKVSDPSNGIFIRRQGSSASKVIIR